jgi:hypothetical protein
MLARVHSPPPAQPPAFSPVSPCRHGISTNHNISVPPETNDSKRDTAGQQYISYASPKSRTCDDKESSPVSSSSTSSSGRFSRVGPTNHSPDQQHGAWATNHSPDQQHGAWATNHSPDQLHGAGPTNRSPDQLHGAGPTNHSPAQTQRTKWYTPPPSHYTHVAARSDALPRRSDDASDSYNSRRRQSLAKCDSQNGLERRRSSVKNCSSSIADIRDDLGQLRDVISAAKTDIRDVSDRFYSSYT